MSCSSTASCASASRVTVGGVLSRTISAPRRRPVARLAEAVGGTRAQVVGVAVVAADRPRARPAPVVRRCIGAGEDGRGAERVAHLDFHQRHARSVGGVARQVSAKSVGELGPMTTACRASMPTCCGGSMSTGWSAQSHSIGGASGMKMSVSVSGVRLSKTRLSSVAHASSGRHTSSGSPATLMQRS